MKKSARVLVAGCLAACAGLAGAREKPPACTYSDQALPAPAEATRRSRIVLQGTTPAAGQAVHPATVIGADVEYHVADFEPGKYELVVHFAQLTVGSSTIIGGRGERYVAQADGIAHLCLPIAGLFRDESIRWPLQMRVSLQKRSGATSSTLHAESRRVEFPSPDLSARVLARQKAAMPEDYYLALDEAFAFIETHRAAYQECTARFPELLDELEPRFREWTARTAGDAQRIESLQMERYAEATRNTTSGAAERLAGVRSDIARHVARDPDLHLRRRCTDLRFVTSGELREFIGRYLAIVDEQVARKRPKVSSE